MIANLVYRLKAFFKRRSPDTPGMFRACIEVDGRKFVLGDAFEAADRRAAACETNERAHQFMFERVLASGSVQMGRMWTERLTG